MKKILLSILVLPIAFACSKNDNSENANQPKSVAGKWDFKIAVGYPATGNAININPFADTLIFGTNQSYFIIKNKDTTGEGTYTIGHGQAINGFGKMQAYDSILYKTNSAAQVALPPQIQYYQIINDTLYVSSEYFKDSSTDKAFINYTRNK